MIDGCGRKIDHLRLSLTDHCNLACRYCIPDGPRPVGSASRGIDPDFAFQTVRWLALKHGIRHVRLTGGEPLLYPDLIPLIKRLSALQTLHEVTLTTNAQALACKADAMHAAGLCRINVSLDTLRPERFAHMTRGGRLIHTLSGVDRAVAVGLTPVKINVVAQRGFNDDELCDLAEWGLSRGCVVRFLEVMPIGPLAHVAEQHLVPAAEILERLAGRFELKAVPQSLGQPATDYAARRPGLRGVIGIIAPTTRPFCSRCRRLRITSDGSVVACVHDAQRLNLSRWWDGHVLDTQGVDTTVRAAAAGKPRVGPQNQSVNMISLGG